jgi:6-hydroxytryprostatin B O-methyltransferase
MVHLVENEGTTIDIYTLKEYAKSITVAVDTITDYLDTAGLPQPSFDPKATNVTLPATAPLPVFQARQQLIASSAAIQKLATEPDEYLPNLAIHVGSSFRNP